MSESPNRLQALPHSNGDFQPPMTKGPQEKTPSPLSFSTEQLEHWKDEIAKWWGAEKLRYDHKRIAALFQQWFRVSKKEAVKMEFNSREEPEKFIEHFLDRIIAAFEKKLHKKPLTRLDIDLSFQTGIRHRPVQGQSTSTTFLVTLVLWEKCITRWTMQMVFQRFISHPFGSIRTFPAVCRVTSGTPPA